MGSFLKLKKLLEEKDGFVLVCHIEPDGDAIGSMLAVGAALKILDKKITYVCKDIVPEVFHFLYKEEKIENKLPEIKQNQALILLDNGDCRRTGFSEDIMRLKRGGFEIANIDHHPKNDLWRIATINYADENASSASEIIYRIFKGLNFEITPSIATALLAGIFYDTGGFKHSNTSIKVLEVASELMKKGARLSKIAEKIENSHPISKFKLWGVALNRLVINQKFGLATSVLTEKDIRKAGASEDEVSGLVNLLSAIPNTKASLLLYEAENGKIKGSLRTEKDDVDLSKLANLLGGGGHKKASGFSLDGRIEINGNKWKIR